MIFFVNWWFAYMLLYESHMIHISNYLIISILYITWIDLITSSHWMVPSSFVLGLHPKATPALSTDPTGYSKPERWQPAHLSNCCVLWKMIMISWLACWTARKYIHIFIYHMYIWVFPKIVGFPPKSSILIGFSIINHPFWGVYPYFWKHPYSLLPLDCRSAQWNETIPWPIAAPSLTASTDLCGSPKISC